MLQRLLLDEPPLVVIPSLATAIGLNEAIVVQQIHYWLQVNARAESLKHYHEGRYWTYNTGSEWAKAFPFWAEPTIRRIFTGLEKSGIFLKGFFNEKSSDRTKWTSIDYDCLEKILSKNQTHRIKSFDQSDQTICSNRSDLICSNRSNLLYTETNTETNYRERSNAHQDSKILSLAPDSNSSDSDLNLENLDPPIIPTLLTEEAETTTEVSTGSAAIVQTYNANTNGLSENSALPPTIPTSSPHEPINEQAWIQAHNNNKPEKWGHLYCGWCFADTMRDAAYAYIKAAGSQQAAIDRHIAALQWIRISGDKREKFFRDLDFSPKQVFNPEKLPMLEFADKASRQNLNPQAVAESGLSESQISEIRAQQRQAERQRTGTSLFRHTRAANHE